MSVYIYIYEMLLNIYLSFSYESLDAMVWYNYINEISNFIDTKGNMSVYVNYFGNDLKFIIPEFFLFFFISFFILFLVIIGNSKSFNYPILQSTSIFLGCFGLFLTIFLYSNNLDFGAFLFHFQFYIDNVSLFFKCFLILGAIICLLLSWNYLFYEGIKSYEYTLIIILSVFGMICLISSYDFISIYLSIELQSLCLYILASYNKSSTLSTESGLKYFILGSLSSGLLLFGFSLIYGLTGMTSLNDLHMLTYDGICFDVNTDFDSNNFTADEFNYHYTFTSCEVDEETGELSANYKPHSYNDLLSLNTYNDILGGFTLGIIFISAAFFFKLGVVPFHVWLPDVYEGVLTSITFFFSIVPKISLFYFILKFYLVIFSEFFDVWSIIFSYCSLLSFLIGSFGALYQIKLKRLIAYSAIGNIGYILLGILCNNLEGIHGSILYLSFYILNLVGLFCAILVLRKQNNNFTLSIIQDLGSLKESNPLICLCMCIFFFSLAGIPPLAGFYGKFFIFFGLVKNSYYFLALFSILVSALSSFYYIRLVKILFFESKKKFFFYNNLTFLHIIPIIYCFLFNIFFFLYPSFFLEFIYLLSINFLV